MAKKKSTTKKKVAKKAAKKTTKKKTNTKTSGFTITILDSRIWNGIMETIGGLIEQAVFIIDENGIAFTAFDISRICLLHLQMTPDMFVEYDIDKKYQIPITITDVVKINKRTGKNDEITLTFDESENLFQITMSRNKPKSTRNFQLRIPKLEEEEDFEYDPDVMTFEHTGSLNFNPALFDEAIKDAEIYSDDLQIEVDPEIGLLFKTEGDVGEMKYVLNKESIEDFEIKELAASKYSLSYLKKIFKITQITNSGSLKIGNEMPITFTFSIDVTMEEKVEGEQDPEEKTIHCGNVLFFLAPKVKSEDEIYDEEYEEGMFDDEFDDLDEIGDVEEEEFDEENLDEDLDE